MKFCKNCGAVMEDNHIFCQKCGAKCDIDYNCETSNQYITDYSFREYKPKWYERFFYTYIRILFFKFSLGSFCVYMASFCACMGFEYLIGTYITTNENILTFFTWVSIILPVIVTVLVNKKVKG